MPKRIQFKRIKGFRLSENCVRVTRPSKWGNPVKIGDNAPWGGTIEFAQDAVDLFEDKILVELENNPDYLEPLRGKDLACFCALDSICHADILLKYANK